MINIFFCPNGVEVHFRTPKLHLSMKMFPILFFSTIGHSLLPEEHHPQEVLYFDNIALDDFGLSDNIGLSFECSLRHSSLDEYTQHNLFSFL